jgi:hypothetical protein
MANIRVTRKVMEPVNGKMTGIKHMVHPMGIQTGTSIMDLEIITRVMVHSKEIGARVINNIKTNRRGCTIKEISQSHNKDQPTGNQASTNNFTMG